MTSDPGIQIAPYLGRGSGGGPPPEPPSLTEQVQALFADGTSGGMWDATDIATLWQDSAGTAPVTAHGQPIGRLADISGNGKHLVQVTALARPTWMANGASFDYTDDFLVTAASMDLTGTNKVSYGHSLVATGGIGLIHEFSANTNSNAGSWYALHGISNGRYDESVSRGNVGAAAVQGTGSGSNLSTKKVISVTHDIGASITTHRRNGVTASPATGNKGSGTFGNYLLYVGARGGSLVRLLGTIARIVIVGRMITSEERDLVEAWCDEPYGVLP